MNSSPLVAFYQMLKEAFSNYYFSIFVYFLIFTYIVLVVSKVIFENQQANKTTEENNLKINLKKTKEDYSLESFKNSFLN